MKTVCQHCGAPLADTDAFCTKCGLARGTPQKSANESSFCMKCGSRLSGQTKFCEKCGSPVSKAVALAATATSSPGPSTARTETPVQAAKTSRFCIHCAAPLEDGAKFCTKCARPVMMAVSAVAGAEKAPSVDSRPAVVGVAAVEPSPARHNRKFLVVGLFALVLVCAIAAGVIYAVHRVKQKATEALMGSDDHASSSTDAGSEINKALDALKGAADAAPGSTNSSSRSSSGSGTPAVGGSNGSPAAQPASNVNSPFEAPPPPVPITPITPSAASGDATKDWALKYERTENGPEADLVVRTGDINNLGFGWPNAFDPFSGNSTPPHPYPWQPRPGAPDGTDRIMIGSALDPIARYPTRWLNLHEGYSDILEPCETLTAQPGQVCKARVESMPQPIRLPVGALPPHINDVVVQMFLDDFQAAVFGSHFQVSLNGTRIPSFESGINSLDQTGPIGKLVTFRLLPEYWPLLKSGEVKLLIDDPTTREGDGYAVDFVRILVNPHKFKYQVSLAATVVDAEKHAPIGGANVTAAQGSAVTDKSGKCQLTGLPAGLVTATAAAADYDENSVPVDLVAGQSGTVEIPLHRHHEDTAALEKELAQTGQATIYGIHFDTGSAKLRPDSLSALNAVLALINNHAGSRWTIAGHTDNQGNATQNQALSQNRSAAVVAWLKDHGVDSTRLVPEGYGATRPLADNATANGRALNRRVEVAIEK